MYKEIISCGVLRDILLMFPQRSFWIKAAISIVVILANFPLNFQSAFTSLLYMSPHECASLTPDVAVNRRIRTTSDWITWAGIRGERFY